MIVNKSLNFSLGIQTAPMMTVDGEPGTLVPKSGKPPFNKENIVDEYVYKDAEGNVVYKVLHDVHKNFWQACPNLQQPNRWILNLKNVELVPYRLPMLLDESRCTVYVVEDEKDADNLNRLFEKCKITDSVATTSAAKNWPRFIEKYHLANKRVIVIPDNNMSGHIFGQGVCKAFIDAGCGNVRMISPPIEKDGDISDLIELLREVGRSPVEIYQEIEALCQQARNLADKTVAQRDADNRDVEPEDENKRQAIIVPFSEVEECETEWLWENKIPAGELCLLSGLAGQGKTFWTCYLAAMVSNGGDWPDETPCPKGNVLFFRGEDSIEKTMKPRLSANGADMDNVILLNEKVDGSNLTLSDVETIRDAIQQAERRNNLPVRLIVIDPMADYLGNAKENSNAGVRTVLSPLKNIAEETGAAFLLIQHTGKAARRSMSMQQRVLGTTGIVASCRASFCLFFDQKTGHRFFAPMKNNLTIDPTSVVFTINSQANSGQVQIIDCDLDKTADEIEEDMKESQQGRGRRPNKSTEVENWLRDFLKDGCKRVGSENDLVPGSICYEAKLAGHSWATVRRAKAAIGVTSSKELNVWFWSLPNLPDLTEQEAQSHEDPTLANFELLGVTT